MKLQDPKALRKQYADSSNLGPRIGLHARFGTNPVPWTAWLFERLGLRAADRVLDVGCGPATLWRANGRRLPDGCSVTLIDLSPGMVGEARAAVGDDARFAFGVGDAQRLPFADGCFDIVVANHMLYHVADLDLALSELSRVLADEGRLVAATNGGGHMPELLDLLDALGLARAKWSYLEAFGLETGVAPVRRHFDDVAVERHPNVLDVTDPQAVVDYMNSLPASRPAKRRAAESDALRLIRRTIDERGAFRITTDGGIITGRKR